MSSVERSGRMELRVEDSRRSLFTIDGCLTSPVMYVQGQGSPSEGQENLGTYPLTPERLYPTIVSPLRKENFLPKYRTCDRGGKVKEDKGNGIISGVEDMNCLV